MLLEPPSKWALTNTFQDVLNGILDGTLQSAPEGNGLDEQTNAALNDLAKHLKTHRAVKALAAQNEFARQLFGQHSAQAQDNLLKLLGP